MNTETALPENQTKAKQPQSEMTDISSMLLPVEGRTLLLPGVVVAEIVTFVTPEPDDSEDVPAWFLGHIYWRNQRVPLAAFETLSGGGVPFISSHCRIAILNNTGMSHQLNFFAILLQGTPKLLRLTPEELFVNNEKISEEGEKLHVTIGGEEAVIPDVEFIERAIVNYLQLS